MKKILISLMLILPAWLLPVSMARAAVPTIDATVLVQAIMIEIEELLVLGEETITVATQYKELAQQYQTYQDYVKQMESVDFSVQWALDLFENAIKGYGDETGGGFAIVTDEGTTEDNRRVILTEHGFGVVTTAEMKAEYQAKGFASETVARTEERMERVNLVYDKYADQLDRVRINRDVLDDLEARKDNTEGQVSGLGKGDDVKALKIIAAQQTLTQEHLQLVATLSNQRLLAYEPPSIRAATQQERQLQGIKDAEVKRKERFIQGFHSVAGGGWDM